MNDIQALTNKIVSFIKERDWEQFHTPKETALALLLEASELNEIFLWKNSYDFNIDKIKEELADVFIYSLDLANQLNLDVSDIVTSKIEINSKKYPVDKCKGSAKKYNEF